jgi:hypothetical protein
MQVFSYSTFEQQVYATCIAMSSSPGVKIGEMWPARVVFVFARQGIEPSTYRLYAQGPTPQGLVTFFYVFAKGEVGEMFGSLRCQNVTTPNTNVTF